LASVDSLRADDPDELTEHVAARQWNPIALTPVTKWPRSAACRRWTKIGHWRSTRQAVEVYKVQRYRRG